MTREEERQELSKYIRQKTKELTKDPKKAREYLIKVGILEKNGKRLARPYRD